MMMQSDFDFDSEKLTPKADVYVWCFWMDETLSVIMLFY